MKRNWEAQHYPQLVGNETWLLQQPNSPSFPVLRVVRNILEEDFKMDTPTPATEMIVGAGLSVMLWCLITLIVFGVSTFVNSLLAV